MKFLSKLFGKGEKPRSQTLVDSMANDALLDAAKRGDTLQLKEALIKGADVNTIENSIPYFNALHYAVAGGYSDVAELLLDNGAKIDSYGNSPLTPLLRAVSNGDKNFTKLLLTRGADVNAHVYGGDGSYRATSLHIAVENGSKEMVELLLEHKANIDARDEFGLTPLHVAAGNNNSEMVMLLLAHGANVEAKTKFNATPLSYALKKGHGKIVELLRSSAKR